MKWAFLMDARGRVPVHEMSLYHGCRGPDWVFVHEMGLSHGHRAPGRGASGRSGFEAAPQGEASPTDLIPVSFQCSSRSSARPPRLQVPQWHSLVPKHLQTNLSRSLSSIPVGPRHGHHAYKCLRDIPAWRRGLLSALWHGDPQLKHFWGRVAWRREGNRYR